MMKDIKWIKLDTNLFDNRKIKAIEAMPDGDALVVIWLKLLILAGIVNDGGCVYFTKDLPFTDQLLATQFNRPLATVQLALATFQRFGMIEIVDDMILVSNWEKYQNVDSLDAIREKTRIRVANYRRKQKLLLSNVTSNVTVTERNAIDKEEDKEKDIKKESKKESKNARNSYDSVIDNFTDDPELIAMIKEFIKMRQLIKKPLTDRALQLMLNKLFGLSKDTETQIKIVEQSIVHNWLTVYSLKEDYKGGNGRRINPALKYQQTQINENDFNNMVVDLNDLDKARKVKNLMDHERKWNPSTDRKKIPEQDINAMIVDLGGEDNDER